MQTYLLCGRYPAMSRRVFLGMDRKSLWTCCFQDNSLFFCVSVKDWHAHRVRKTAVKNPKINYKYKFSIKSVRIRKDSTPELILHSFSEKCEGKCAKSAEITTFWKIGNFKVWSKSRQRLVETFFWVNASSLSNTCLRSLLIEWKCSRLWQWDYSRTATSSKNP